MPLNAAQCRAARALLKWSQDKLAAVSNVSASTVGDFERGVRTPHDHILADVRSALESAGIEFTDGERPGVRLRKEGPLESEA
jgi:transcriptional regulator with XRE-family HTH domain